MVLSFVSPNSSSSFSLVILILLARHEYVGSCNFTSIFSFGDSLADTGNRLIDSGMEAVAGQFPYGTTYFHRPTGRYSDGRIVLDFIAQGLGLPLLEPYLANNGGGEEFRHGVNFAVAGATAHENGFFRELGLNVTWTEYNLASQIEWFKKLLPRLTSKPGPGRGPGRSRGRDLTEILSTSLILMGEIGGNDYNHALQQYLPIHQIRSYVPEVIKIISSAIHDLIQLGARTMVVPGITPLGCAPRYLATYGRRNTTSNALGEARFYDLQTGCIQWLNELAEYHNGLLGDELNLIRLRYPNATVVYVDYYEAYMTIYRAPRKYGFERSLEACCGGMDPANPYSEFINCGDKRTHMCSNPSSYVSWDGVHYTEATYRIIANDMLDGTHVFPTTNIHECSSHKQISTY